MSLSRVEPSTHLVRLTFSGAFDGFPRSRIVLGHMGEALPFWMWRLNFMGAPGAPSAIVMSLRPGYS